MSPSFHEGSKFTSLPAAGAEDTGDVWDLFDQQSGDGTPRLVGVEGFGADDANSPARRILGT